ncbi:GNAT family N-acetyltransferase [Spirochaeta cellobiosiphila]|uniref:GNAT family N-acetyltransferase n=1 Tax=Spirochaeta cellobiosiphila TaxID=504483 RepID=UPI0004913778|nr:GNAT family N-acetyltransferase [Spirochaeta cellobiosiphila]
MIKCKDEHKEFLLKHLKESPAFNCFLIGDLENHSLEEDYLDIWVDSLKEPPQVYLLKYFDNYVVSGEGDMAAAYEVLKTQEPRMLSGPQNSVTLLNQYLKSDQFQTLYLAEARSTSVERPKDIHSHLATPEDLDDLFDFQKSIKEFSGSLSKREHYGQDILKGSGRIAFIRDKERIVSTAQISAENSMNGMLIGVATDPHYRKKGYATVNILAICEDMFKEGKSAILFYDNPEAGRLYKKLGFQDIGLWMMGNLSS